MSAPLFAEILKGFRLLNLAYPLATLAPLSTIERGKTGITSLSLPEGDKSSITSLSLPEGGKSSITSFSHP